MISLCHCPECRAAETARQRKLTIVLSTILVGAVWMLFKEIWK